MISPLVPGGTDYPVGSYAGLLQGPRRACGNCQKVLNLSATHPICRACRRASGWRGYVDTQKISARNARGVQAFKARHPERMRELARADANRRRARKRDQFIESVDPAVVWRRDRGICHICSLPADPADWHLEHVVALVNGGDHSYANTAVAHPACNLKKGAR